VREIVVQGVTTPVRESGAGQPVILLRLHQKGAKLTRFADAGHWIPVEKADAVAKHLAEFLA
jgi:pimeloyl-ACP methyl ester carboxylesterase